MAGDSTKVSIKWDKPWELWQVWNILAHSLWKGLRQSYMGEELLFNDLTKPVFIWFPRVSHFTCFAELNCSIQL